MEERLTDQVPGPVSALPEVPSSPAALFGPIAAPVEEPAMTAASVPPTPPTPPTTAPTPRQRNWPKYVAIGAVAILLGAAVGWFAGGPQRNDLTAQRDDALAQVDTLTGQLADSEAKLGTTEGLLSEAEEGLAAATADLEAAQEELASMTDARDVASTRADACELASVTASDLVGQWRNLFGDMVDLMFMPYPSAQFDELDRHMDEQSQKMGEQQVALDRAMNKCLG